MNEKNSKPETTIQEVEIFLGQISEKANILTSHMDTQTNILIGLSSAIFVFSTSAYRSDHSFFFLVLAIFSALSACVGLVGIHPFKFMRKRGGTESVMYNKLIAKCSCPEEYEKILLEVVDTRKDLVHQYATEIHNRIKYYYRPKRELFTLARNILVIGIAATAVSVLVSYIVQLAGQR